LGASVSNKLQLVSDVDAAVEIPSDSKAVQMQSCQTMPKPTGASRANKRLNPENISLLNWNIYKGNEEGWQKDLSSFSERHELMTIQEATLDEQYLALLQDYNFGWTLNAAYHFNGVTAGVMNIAKADSIYSCGFNVSEPIIRIPKSALISYYAIDGRDEKLLVANIHGINFTFGLGAYTEQLTMLYDALSQHEGPIILAGDFNSWSEERLNEVDKLVARLSLSKLEYQINNKTHVFGNAIDHVFYRQLELLDKQVVQVSSSDHNPISVSFRLQ
jgi:endonuclease/exonuclease/phosphatase (EEP) superfamily protein YafD